MCLDKARKMLRRDQGLGDRGFAFAGCRVAIGVGHQPVEQEAGCLRKALEIEAGQGVIIEKGAADLRSADQDQASRPLDNPDRYPAIAAGPSAA